MSIIALNHHNEVIAQRYIGVAPSRKVLNAIFDGFRESVRAEHKFDSIEFFIQY